MGYETETLFTGQLITDHQSPHRKYRVKRSGGFPKIINRKGKTFLGILYQMLRLKIFFDFLAGET